MEIYSRLPARAGFVATKVDDKVYIFVCAAKNFYALLNSIKIVALLLQIKGKQHLVKFRHEVYAWKRF